MSYLDRFRLDGKTALVTGASKGIGRASTYALADAGANIVLAARSQKDLDIVAQEVEKRGVRAATILCDTRKEEDLRALATKAKSAIDAPTILINNAGGGGPNNPRTEDIDVLNQQFYFNAASPYLLTTLLAPGMEDAGGGVVVNISSQAGVIGQKGFAAYGTAKAALNQLTRNLAQDYAPLIRINSVAPGAVMTDALAPYVTDETRAKMEDKTPLGRIAEPEEVASTVLYLASSASQFMTGRTLVLDGGAEWTTWPF